MKTQLHQMSERLTIALAKAEKLKVNLALSQKDINALNDSIERMIDLIEQMKKEERGRK